MAQHQKDGKHIQEVAVYEEGEEDIYNSKTTKSFKLKLAQD